MGLLNFKDLNLEKNNNIITINFNEKEIQIVEYLTISEKKALIENILKESNENGFYNPVYLRIFGTVYFVSMYTNILFSNEDLTDFGALYDDIINSGLLAAIEAAVPRSELEFLYEMTKKTLEERKAFSTSILGLLSSLFDQATQKFKKITDELNLEGFLTPEVKEQLNKAIDTKDLKGTLTKLFQSIGYPNNK